MTSQFPFPYAKTVCLASNRVTAQLGNGAVVYELEQDIDDG